MHLPATLTSILLLTAAVPGAAQASSLKAAIATQPALVTCVGQSADIEMVKVLLTRGKLAFKADPQARAGALAATGSKTLVLVIGGSSKGLGAAGISPEVDIERAKGLVAEARKSGCKVIGLHVGGEGRRGQMSDKFIQGAVPLCDYVVVVAGGNKDGLFNQLCGKGKIPLDSVEKIALAGAPIVKAFH
jgi:hypothetical protein